MMHPRITQMFWDEGIGAMSWGVDSKGRRVLYLIIPCPQIPAPKGQFIRVYTKASKTSWTRPGPDLHWDENEEEPTLFPSIFVPGMWHGYVRKGRLEHCEDSPHLKGV